MIIPADIHRFFSLPDQLEARMNALRDQAMRCQEPLERKTNEGSPVLPIPGGFCLAELSPSSDLCRFMQDVERLLTQLRSSNVYTDELLFPSGDAIGQLSCGNPKLKQTLDTLNTMRKGFESIRRAIMPLRPELNPNNQAEMRYACINKLLGTDTDEPGPFVASLNAPMLSSLSKTIDSQRIGIWANWIGSLKDRSTTNISATLIARVGELDTLAKEITCPTCYKARLIPFVASGIIFIHLTNLNECIEPKRCLSI